MNCGHHELIETDSAPLPVPIFHILFPDIVDLHVQTLLQPFISFKCHSISSASQRSWTQRRRRLFLAPTLKTRCGALMMMMGDHARVAHSPRWFARIDPILNAWPHTMDLKVSHIPVMRAAHHASVAAKGASMPPLTRHHVRHRVDALSRVKGPYIGAPNKSSEKCQMCALHVLKGDNEKFRVDGAIIYGVSLRGASAVILNGLCCLNILGYNRS